MRALDGLALRALIRCASSVGFEDPDPRFTLRELGTLSFHHIFGSLRCESWTCQEAPVTVSSGPRASARSRFETGALRFAIALDDESQCDAAAPWFGRPLVLAGRTSAESARRPSPGS